MKNLEELDIGQCFIVVDSEENLNNFPTYLCFHLWRVLKKGEKILAERCFKSGEDDEFSPDMLVMLVV